MEKKKIEIIVIAVLGIFLITLLMNTLGKGKKVPEQGMEVKEAVAEKVSTPAVQPVPEMEKPVPVEPVNLDWGRDPFAKVPTAIKKSKKHQLILSAVIWDEKEPHAIINNEVVVIGEEIDGHRVKKINNNNVVLEKAGREITVELY